MKNELKRVPVLQRALELTRRLVWEHSGTAGGAHSGTAGEEHCCTVAWEHCCTVGGGRSGTAGEARCCTADVGPSGIPGGEPRRRKISKL